MIELLCPHLQIRSVLRAKGKERVLDRKKEERSTRTLPGCWDRIGEYSDSIPDRLSRRRRLGAGQTGCIVREYEDGELYCSAAEANFLIWPG